MRQIGVELNIGMKQRRIDETGLVIKRDYLSVHLKFHPAVHRELCRVCHELDCTIQAYFDRLLESVLLPQDMDSLEVDE